MFFIHTEKDHYLYFIHIAHKILSWFLFNTRNPNMLVVFKN